MKVNFKKVGSAIATVLVAIVALVAIILVCLRIFGFQIFNIISPSMTPTYNVGDLIFVKSAQFEEIKEGTPITFVLNEQLTVATHRVVRVDAENQRFYTKGDANEIEDTTPVHYSNVVGTPVFNIPLLGYVSDFIRHSPGNYIAMAAAVLLLLAVFLPDILKKKQTAKSTANNASENDKPNLD